MRELAATGRFVRLIVDDHGVFEDEIGIAFPVGWFQTDEVWRVGHSFHAETLVVHGGGVYVPAVMVIYAQIYLPSFHRRVLDTSGDAVGGLCLRRISSTGKQ